MKLHRPPRPQERPYLQVPAVRRVFPQFRARITRRGGADWLGSLQPSADSPEYRVRILHEPGRTPVVRVVHPKIRPEAPHRYPDGSLCLFWPDEWWWTPRESLADTIIPWTAFWLYYYEIWLVTGEWLGPSSPHRTGTPKEAA